MKLRRLRGRKEAERVLKKGGRVRGKHMGIFLLKSTKGGVRREVYAGVSVSRKLAKRAVDRNRMRRRCREAFRVLLEETGGLSSLAGAELLILPRPSSLHCDFDELKADIRSLLSLQ
jgi:ribonuclease P protein component